MVSSLQLNDNCMGSVLFATSRTYLPGVPGLREKVATSLTILDTDIKLAVNPHVLCHTCCKIVVVQFSSYPHSNPICEFVEVLSSACPSLLTAQWTIEAHDTPSMNYAPRLAELANWLKTRQVWNVKFDIWSPGNDYHHLPLSWSGWTPSAAAFESLSTWTLEFAIRNVPSQSAYDELEFKKVMDAGWKRVIVKFDSNCLHYGYRGATDYIFDRCGGSIPLITSGILPRVSPFNIQKLVLNCDTFFNANDLMDVVRVTTSLVHVRVPCRNLNDIETIIQNNRSLVLLHTVSEQKWHPFQINDDDEKRLNKLYFGHPELVVLRIDDKDNRALPYDSPEIQAKKFESNYNHQVVVWYTAVLVSFLRANAGNALRHSIFDLLKAWPILVEGGIDFGSYDALSNALSNAIEKLKLGSIELCLDKFYATKYCRNILGLSDASRKRVRHVDESSTQSK